MCVCVCCFLFLFFWQCHAACRILVPQPGIEPVSPALGAQSLTIGPPGKFPCCGPLIFVYYMCLFFFSLFFPFLVMIFVKQNFKILNVKKHKNLLFVICAFLYVVKKSFLKLFLILLGANGFMLIRKRSLPSRNEYWIIYK